LFKTPLTVKQLDMEMNETEKLLRELWYKVPKVKTPDKFQRMTYQEAMASYGSDKPDLRFEAKVRCVNTGCHVSQVDERRYIPSLNI
jgi:aspartyl-tRNA synthetase